MLLILDGNNLAWAGYYALERAMKPDNPERKQRVALLGLASTALGAIARGGVAPATAARGAVAPSGQGALAGMEAAPAAPVGPALTAVAIAFDEGRPLRRREKFPAYQTGREGDPKFVENEPTILAAIAEFSRACETMLPFDVLRERNTEADDLIAGLVHHNPATSKRIVSTDRDFLQLIDANTSVYSPVKKIVIDEANFNDEAMPKTSTGEPVPFPRERFLDYRALTGDPSDNLPGVPGIGPLTAAKLLAGAPLDEYFGAPDAVRKASGRKSAAVEAAFADGSAQAVVARNRELMDLRRPAPCWDDLPSHTTRGRYDRTALEAWLDGEKIQTVDRAQLIACLDALTL